MDLPRLLGRAGRPARPSPSGSFRPVDYERALPEVRGRRIGFPDALRGPRRPSSDPVAQSLVPEK
jgi:hypothetical protein